MKNSILILMLVLMLALVSCNEYTVKESYTDKSVREFNALERPVVLAGKEKSLGGYSITVLSRNGKVYTIGNMSTLATTIGESRNVGDTLAK